MRNFVKRSLLRLKNPTVRFGKDTVISKSAKFGGYNRIGAGSLFSGSMGAYSYIGENCRICAHIGKFCSVANDVVTVCGTHPTRQWVSTHPAFYSAAKQCGTCFVSRTLFEEETPSATIGNDVWIGAGAQLIGGVIVGNGAIIAAGAVVTKNVAPYSIVAGNPAREIRKRFSEEDIAFLQQLSWWDKPEDWLRSHADCFKNISLLRSAEEKEKL